MSIINSARTPTYVHYLLLCTYPAYQELVPDRTGHGSRSDEFLERSIRAYFLNRTY